ncbi:MAG: hypothetical protein ACRDBL_11385 [Rhabdaerophilum sp.]|jgi:hypothetical protein
MRADAKARQSAIEEQVAVQWLAAQMQVMASGGKLAPLEDWLAKVRPRPKRTVRDMILALQDAQARGANITITKVEG